MGELRPQYFHPAIIFAISLLFLSNEAFATVSDVYGNGARSIGMAGGGVSIVDDGGSSMLNPAGLARIDDLAVGLSWSSARAKFKQIDELWWDTNRDGLVDERDEPLNYSANVNDATGLHLQGGWSVGGKFVVGINGYVPSERLLRFRTFDPELPTYFLYENRPQRFTLALGVGADIGMGISLGAAVDVLASANFTLLTTIEMGVSANDTSSPGLDGIVEQIEVDVHALQLDVVPDYAPIIGFQWDLGQAVPKLDGWQIGATYHGSAGLMIEAEIDLQTNLSAKDIGSLEPILIAALLDAGVFVPDHYIPASWNFGVGYKDPDKFSAYVDLKWTDWRPMVPNIAQVTALDVTAPLLELEQAVVDGNTLNANFKATWTPRAGFEATIYNMPTDGRLKHIKVIFRGGGGYEPTPLVDQTEESALLDADKAFFAAGLGIEHADPLRLIPGRVRTDLAVQSHHLFSDQLSRSSDEPIAGYPRNDDSISIGGDIFVLSAQLSFTL